MQQAGGRGAGAVVVDAADAGGGHGQPEPDRHRPPGPGARPQAAADQPGADGDIGEGGGGVDRLGDQPVVEPLAVARPEGHGTAPAFRPQPVRSMLAPRVRSSSMRS